MVAPKMRLNLPFAGATQSCGWREGCVAGVTSRGLLPGGCQHEATDVWDHLSAPFSAILFVTDITW